MLTAAIIAAVIPARALMFLLLKLRLCTESGSADRSVLL